MRCTKLIGRCEQVIADGYQVQQMATLKEVTRGTFFVDLQAHRLYLWDRMNRDPVKWRHHVVRPAI